MNCARCLLRCQSGSLASTARTLVQHAALLKPSSQPLTQAPPQHLPPLNTPGQTLRRFHCTPTHAKRQPTTTSPTTGDDDAPKKALVAHDDLFERVAKEAKTKATFDRVIEVFKKRDIRRRGHVEFIYAALKKMPEFGVARDLAVYNRLLDVFPKEVFVPRNFIQRMFNHYPRQQECGVQVLEQMEQNGVMPNVETKVLLIQIFGEKGHPVRKFQRLMYWFPKFMHTNPFPLPLHMPDDPVDLSRLSLQRIANDLSAEVTVYQMPCTDISESGEIITQPHVVGIQSPDQVELLAQHNPSRPLFVEGPHPLWLRKKCVYYYVLKADPLPPTDEEEPYDPERCFDYPLQLDLDLDIDLREDLSFDVDDVPEGPVYAMCMSGRGDQATLNQWISGLQETNPILGRIPTLFRIEPGPGQLQETEHSDPDREPRPEADDVDTDSQAGQEQQTKMDIEEEEPRRSQGMKQ